MIYTALGDSITFGENASCLDKAYPQLIVNVLGSRSIKVRGNVIAQPGWTSADLLDTVIWRAPYIIKQSTVVSIWIGGVDLGLAGLSSLRNLNVSNANHNLENYYRNLGSILAEIKTNSHAHIICCTQYNPFPNSPLAVKWIHQLNLVTKEIAQRNQVGIAPVHTWFENKQAELIYGYRNGKIEDSLRGSPPIHPNDMGHRIIALRLIPFLISKN
jgi:lysophospholipase L1-like esterase